MRSRSTLVLAGMFGAVVLVVGSCADPSAPSEVSGLENVGSDIAAAKKEKTLSISKLDLSSSTLALGGPGPGTPSLSAARRQ